MNFSQMALEKLNAASPGLSKYIVAFKDMSSELSESDGVEVGVFIMRNGGNLFYIPVISRGGVIFPIDSIYLADRKAFFPLTKKTIEQVRAAQNAGMGAAARTPQGAISNPDLKDLVVPPRTGKFMYASDGRLDGIIAMSDPAIRGELADTLTQNPEISDSIGRLLNLEKFAEALRTVEKLPEVQMVKEAQVLTDTPDFAAGGAPLSHEAVQDIVQKGYHIAGEHSTTRVVIESAGANHYTKLKAAEEGHAYMAEGVGGGEIPIAVLRQCGAPVDTRQVLVCTVEGQFGLVDKDVVIHQQEVPYDEVTANLSGVPAGELALLLDGAEDKKVMFFDGTGYFLFDIDGMPLMDAHSTTYRGTFQGGSNGRVIVTEGMHGLVHCQSNERGGQDVFLNAVCRAYVGHRSSLGSQFEKSIAATVTRHEHRTTSYLPDYHTMSFHNGEFAIDGRPVGGRPEAARMLVENMMLQPIDTENLMKSAEERKMIGMHMSKQAAAVEGSRPTPFFEYGQKLPPAPTMAGSRQERQMGQTDRLNAAAKTNDKSVVEATIIAELLSDPNMFETINEYLPEIGSAVDRLGRILFLARVNSNRLSDSLDPEALSNMVTNLRSSYQNLGESYIKLEQIASNV